MDNVRIIEEKTDKTKKSIYYIEEKRKFLWWSWWSRETASIPLCPELTGNVIYNEYNDALKKYNSLTKLITKKVVKIN